jgi:ankyrin repeat protein
VLALLLEKGADVNLAVNNGAMPLILASSKGHVECVILLLKGGADRKVPWNGKVVFCLCLH